MAKLPRTTVPLDQGMLDRFERLRASRAVGNARPPLAAIIRAAAAIGLDVLEAAAVAPLEVPIEAL